jgi:cell wall-associated NlpC family hydrolase/DNA-directed RNA polymerase subunit H (RpoH/RPB5)
MKCFKWIVFLLIVNSLTVFSQEKYTQHTVAKGETISGIAKKYNVKSSEIYELNPDARNGIKYKTVLLIPSKAINNSVSTLKIANNFSEKSHEVLAKETLYGIAKQYNITIEDLYKINPNLEKEGLKKSQIIKISQTVSQDLVKTKEPEKAIEGKNPIVSKENIPKEETVVAPKAAEKISIPTQGIEYEVLPKESYYSIAKKYQISVVDLQKANSNLGAKSLKVGQKIIVPAKSEANSSLAFEKSTIKEIQEVKVISQEVVAEKKLESEITHEVLPKETKYGIAKEYGITIAELEKQNPNIAKKLLVGSVLKIHSSKIIEVNVPVPVNPVVVKEESDKKDFDSNVNRVNDVAFVDQLIATASENIGTRYRTGGATKDGFDCSGLMYSTFSIYDIKLPRSSIEMAAYGSKIDTENAQKGDLIFFKTNRRGRINHVGMIVEVLENEIKFIHSATHGGVIISSTKESYYEKNLVQVNRVL